MAWMVEHLIKNSISIESSGDIESDSFFDLILVKDTIDKLTKEDKLSKTELLVLDAMFGNSTMEGATKLTKLSRPTISKLFVRATDKIANELGEAFTDTGLIEKLSADKKLSEKEIQILTNYISSKYKHKLMRKNHVK